MSSKNYFRNKSDLYRKFVASALAAVFSAGTFSSYVDVVQQLQQLFPHLINNKTELEDKLDINILKNKDPGASIYQYNCSNPDSKEILNKLEILGTNS